jgi:hypothetical protein
VLAPRSSAVLTAAWTLILGACVCPPSPEDVLQIGFRTPEQAFRTFQTATRLDDPDLELRCFSSGFRERNQISQLTWRVGREDLYRRQPWLRVGIVGAEVIEREVREPRARLRIDTAAGDYQVDLVREDFAEGWAGGERVFDVELGGADRPPWEKTTGVQRDAENSDWFYGRVELPAGVDGGALTDVRFGREWKIDGVTPLEPPPREPIPDE